jgi:hypothetical protein
MDLSLNEERRINDCLNVNLKVLRLVGLWQDFTPTKHFPWTVKLFSHYKWMLLFLMIAHTTSEITDILLTWGDLKNLAENGSVALIYAAAIFKQINFLLRQKRIKGITHNVKNNLFSKLMKWREHQDTISRKANRRAHIVSWTYYGFGIVAVSCFVLMAIFKSYAEYFGFGKIQGNKGNSTLKTPIFKAWFPFDIQQSRYYVLAFVFQLLLGICGPMINIGIDTFVLGLIIHCCGQFKILKYSLRTIRERAEILVAQEIISIEKRKSGKEIPKHKKNVKSEEPGITTGDVCV